ncbi:MAG: response regulator [Magnetococcus sp. DMHC-6]
MIDINRAKVAIQAKNTYQATMGYENQSRCTDTIATRPEESLMTFMNEMLNLPKMESVNFNLEEIVLNKRHLSILVVDDSPDNRILIQAFLSKSTHTLTLVNNGQEALDIFFVRSFDLVLMDLEMPIMDGFTAINRIRAWEAAQKSPPVPIIALTAHDFQEVRDRINQAGCDMHLAKPIRKGALLDLIENFAESPCYRKSYH